MTTFGRNSLFAFTLSFLTIGCIQQLAIRTVGGIIDEYGFATLNEESDLDLAEQSIASNLKLIEIFLRGDPTDKNLRLLLSMGYTSYALGFVEDVDIPRARMFYLRGRDYGLSVLRNTSSGGSFDGGMEEFHKAINTLSADDVPAVFWTAMGWGSFVNLSLTDPDALADLPKVEAMMEFVRHKDSTFYYGGAYLFLGTLYGSRPKMLGGDLERSERYFRECLRITNENFLLTHVFFARSFAVQSQDRQLFEDLLSRVENASLDSLPEARLPNAIAKKKASLLRLKMDELF
jgi:hypothetical protein